MILSSWKIQHHSLHMVLSNRSGIVAPKRQVSSHWSLVSACQSLINTPAIIVCSPQGLCCFHAALEHEDVIIAGTAVYPPKSIPSSFLMMEL